MLKLNKYQQKIIIILDKWYSGKDLTMEDIKELGYANLYDFYELEENRPWLKITDTIKNVFGGVMDKYAEEYSEYDPDYPNNPYLFGYKLDGEIFITGYTGVAGAYWNDNPDTYTICL